MTTSFGDLTSYYAEWLAYRRWHARVPGVQWAVREGGRMLASGALGVADAGRGVPLTEGHLFRVASHSKSLAAVLVLQLVEQGALRLDDAVSTHVAELDGSPVGDRTLRELLAHGGGVIRDSEDGDFWQFGGDFPDREALLSIARERSAATLPRNEHFKYSNIGFGLLGLVLRAATGATFPELVTERIAAPLGLADLGGEYDPARADDYAAGHSSLALTRERSVLGHVDTRALAAATGAWATASDLTAFYAALLPDTDGLLHADSLRQQRRPQWDIRAAVEPGARGYGLGLFLDVIGGTHVYGHTGGYPGHITATYADPDSRRVVSVLTNAIDGPASDLASGFVALSSLAARATHARCDDAVAHRFTGRFASRWGVLDVVRLGGRLFALDPTKADPTADPAELEVADGTSLRIVGGFGGNSYGERMPYSFASDEAVLSLRGNSAMTYEPFAVPADIG